MVLLLYQNNKIIKTLLFIAKLRSYYTWLVKRLGDSPDESDPFIAIHSPHKPSRPGPLTPCEYLLCTSCDAATRT